MKKCLLLILCLVSSLIASAESGTCGDNLTWSLEDGLLVISGTGTMTNYSSADDVPWYSSRSSVYLAIIGEGVTNLGDRAFEGCSNLMSITIPNSVTTIGSNTFYECTSLITIKIPSSVTYIYDGAFAWCSGLSSITIPSSVTSIGDEAFWGCSGLTSVNVSCNDVEDFCNYVQRTDLYFYFSSGLYSKAHNIYIAGELQTSITIPSSVTNIGEYVFCGCSGLTSITIPNSVTSIGGDAFYGCSGLTSVNITDLASWCNIDFGNYNANPTSYAHKLVLNGTEIKDLVIPEEVTAIKNSAFRGCSGLTSITIPNSVTSIGGDAFVGCSGLTSVNIIDLASWCNIKFGNYYSNPLYYAHKLVLNGQEITELVIPDGVTEIKGYAFFYDKSLVSVTIPNSVVSIGRQSFSQNWNLTSITIPNSVTLIEDAAFSNDLALPSVTIPSSVTSIGESVLYNCPSLTYVSVLATVPPTIGSDLLTRAGTSTIHVYEGLAKAYRFADGWSHYSIVDDIPATRVTNITLDATRYQCDIGQRFTPQVVAYEPEDATFKEVTWSSSDPSTLAIAPGTGVCIGIKDGIVTITATAKDANHATATATVYVGNVNPEDAVTISASSVNSTMGTVSGGGDFLPGATVTLTATPARGFEFQSWSDGSIDNPYTFIAAEDKELIAYFKPSNEPQVLSKTKASTLKPTQWYVITQNRNGESPAYEDVANSRVMRAPIDVDVHVGDYFEDVKNFLVRFLPTENEGVYKIQWGTDHYWFTTSSTNYGSGGILVQTVTDETNAGNYFVYNINGQDGHFGMSLTTNNSTYGLIVDNNGVESTVSLWGSGKVNSINGNNDWTFYEVEVSERLEVEITADCEIEQGSVLGSGVYTKGTEVTLTATPAEGYKFIRWSDGSTENPYTFIATKDKSLTAEFKEIHMVLTDGEAYTNTTEETYDYVSYTRTFDDTEWQALYVPFQMSYEDWCDDFEVAKINMFHQYDTDDDGNFDKLELEIVKVKSGTLIANHPYLIKALNSGEKTITLESATLYPAEENNFVCNSMETTYTFTGAYAGVSGAEMYDNRYYSMGGGALIYAEDDTANLKPFRWYLKLTDREGQVIPAPNQIRVMEWNGQTTSLESLSLYNAPARAMSLDGRCVKDMKARGLYIVNGKKVLR